MSKEIIERIIEIEQQAAELVKQADQQAGELRAEQSQKILGLQEALKKSNSQLKAEAQAQTATLNADHLQKLNIAIKDAIEKLDQQARSNLNLAKQIGLQAIIKGY